MYQMMKKFTIVSEKRAQLYIAEIILGINALHSADIIYRDVKAENLMLDLKGHIRITDFGLSKLNVTGYATEGRPTFTFCGTPEYMAPEICSLGMVHAHIPKKGYGKAVDWWSVGVFLFEMLYGQPPFYDTNNNVIYRKILGDSLTFREPFSCNSNGRSVLCNPSREAKKIIKSFLEKDPTKRLGSTDGFREISRHSFFSNLDFNVVAAKGIIPEYTPEIKTELDTGNFDPAFVREHGNSFDTPIGELSGSQQSESNYAGFTFDEKATLRP